MSTILTAGTAPASHAFYYTDDVDTSAAWVTVDFTGGSWADREDIFIARIDLRLVGAEAGDTLSITPGTVAAPGTAHLVADHQAGLQLAFTDSPKQTTWTWKTSGELAVSMVVWYNMIPQGFR